MRFPADHISLSVCVAIAALWLSSSQVRAEPPALDLRTLQSPVSLVPLVSWLEDPSWELSLREVMETSAPRFRTAGSEGLSFGYVRSAYWLQFQVENPSKHADDWLLELAYPHLKDVDLFAVHADGRVDHVRGGNHLPFAARLIDYPHFAFPLQTPAAQTTRFFLRVRSDGAMLAPLVAWRLPDFVSDVAQRNAWLWLFLGGTALMVAFNLGVAGLLRSREYAYCGLMLLAQGFVIFTLSGETYHYFLPTHPELATHMHAISYVLLAMAIQAYGRAVMRRLPDPPSSLRYLDLTMPITGAVLIFAALGPMWLTIRLTLAFSVGMAGFAMFVLHTLRSYRELRFHLISFYVLLLTFPIAVVAYANFIKPHPLAFLAANIGCGLHAVLTSLALPQHIREMGARLARMNTQLQLNVVQLEHALVSAEQATKSKDLFLANMSHELRTPLNAIINVPQGLVEDFEALAAARCVQCSATYLLDPGETVDGAACSVCSGTLEPQTKLAYRGDPQRSVRYLRKVERCGHHLLRMVNDVLDFSKMEAGHLELAPTELSLGELIAEAADEMSELAASKRITIELALEPSPEPSQGDPLRLKQILFNLLSNAIKFSEPDARVLVRWQQPPDCDLVMVVDSGIGIAPEHHERIFELFEQVHGGQRKYGGTGLGLSISRTLSRRHGGELWVESALGKGSTFLLRIPRPPIQREQRAVSYSGNHLR
jgi:signal transduction histidine kinase